MRTSPKRRRMGAVGAGLAALSRAYKLAMLGYGATIFEAKAMPEWSDYDAAVRI